MRRSLADVRRRVERLAADVMSDCRENHHVLKFTYLKPGEAEPEWPGADAPERCACGHEIAYVQFVYSVMEPGERREPGWGEVSAGKPFPSPWNT